MKPDRKNLDAWLLANRLKCAEATRTHKPQDIEEFIDNDLDALFCLNEKPKKGQTK